MARFISPVLGQRKDAAASVGRTDTESPQLNALMGIALDSFSVSQEALNIEDKVRSNMLPWKGQFSPQLVHAFLDNFASTDDVILDPFMGSGTVLGESALLGYQAYGADINPAAYHLAQVYELAALGPEDREASLLAVSDALGPIGLDNAPLFRRICPLKGEEMVRAVVSALSPVQGPWSRIIADALLILADVYRPGLDTDRIRSTWHRLQRIVKALPLCSVGITAMNCDARSLPLPAASIDLVITSPPYINVFNYHQQYRASAEAIGWDVLHAARSEIGANRKHRGNRFLTVIQYTRDMADVLAELRRLITPTGRAIIVVGRESNVRKTPFYNGDLLASVAMRASDLRVVSRQERVFMNRYGQSIVEDILHLTPANDQNATLEVPEHIAVEALDAALTYAPSESRDDLLAAIERAESVKPSQLYEPMYPHQRGCR